jgi:hypothetical protein
MDHGELSRNLVATDRNVASKLLGVTQDVEEPSGRLDHNSICTFVEIPLDGTENSSWWVWLLFDVVGVMYPADFPVPSLPFDVKSDHSGSFRGPCPWDEAKRLPSGPPNPNLSKVGTNCSSADTKVRLRWF